MKLIIKFIFLLLIYTSFDLSFADSKSVYFNVPKNISDTQNKDTLSGKLDIKEENPITKTETWAIKKPDPEKVDKLAKDEEALLVKNLNNIIIETYKPIISWFLDDLYKNIKDKKKEEKLKILSTVIISIKSRINIINSSKFKISEKKKVILTAIFDYIIWDIELWIQMIAKDK